MGSNLGAVLVAGLEGLALQLPDAVRDGEAAAEDEGVPFCDTVTHYKLSYVVCRIFQI